jgi:dTDP-4-amino-4,6-dideoxygalactose transaminase
LEIQGSSIIVPTNTFFDTVAAIIHAGGKVIFADITESMCLSLDRLGRKYRKIPRL